MPSKCCLCFVVSFKNLQTNDQLEGEEAMYDFLPLEMCHVFTCMALTSQLPGGSFCKDKENVWAERRKSAKCVDLGLSKPQ